MYCNDVNAFSVKFSYCIIARITVLHYYVKEASGLVSVVNIIILVLCC